jgi:hypothetical protein
MKKQPIKEVLETREMLEDSRAMVKRARMERKAAKEAVEASKRTLAKALACLKNAKLN